MLNSKINVMSMILAVLVLILCFETTVYAHNAKMFPVTIHFPANSYDLPIGNRDRLKHIAEWLKDNPEYNLVIEGHTDERGTREYMFSIGEKMAMSVKDCLVSFGVSRNRMKDISYGKSRPVSFGHDEKSWSKNRRVVIREMK